VGTVVEFAKFSSQPDKSLSKETLVPLENVPLENPTGGLFTAELQADLIALSAMALRKKYAHEADTHKSRQNACKGKWAPEFKKLRSFLAHVGICPYPNWTLDRIDNKNPDYGPGLVRWASKKVQTRNRSTTITVNFEGKPTPLAEVAEITGQDYETLRKRHQRGWSDHEIVFGKSARCDNDSAEGQWRELLPERMWDRWEWFEQNTLVVGREHLPNGWQSASTEFLDNFVAGPRGRALRLYTTAGRYVDALVEQLADAQQYTEQFGGDGPDPELVKKCEFWTEARARALAVLSPRRAKP
jgi:hypothetical protein